MEPLLKFRCRRPISGFRLLDVDNDDWSSAIATENKDTERDRTDAHFLARKWGSRGLPENNSSVNSLILEPISSEMEEFDLFETYPAAFRQVAAAVPRIDDIKTLADRYGSLVEYSRPEDVALWRLAIRRLRTGIALWDEAKTTDFKRLCRWFERSDVFTDNGGVEGRISLTNDGTSGSARLSIGPPDLMTALMVQFAMAVDGNANFRRCEQCIEWFPVAAAGHRPDRLYCSDACRMRAYRNRKSDI